MTSRRATGGACAIVLALVVALVACDADANEPAGTPAEHRAPELSAAAIDRARSATFEVRAHGCPQTAFGTASLVDDATAITAAHVVAGASDVEMIDVDGHEHDAEVVHFDADLDVAVLRAPTVTAEPIAVGASVTADDRGVLLLPRVDPTDESSRRIEASDVTVIRSVDIETTDIYLDVDVTRSGFEIGALIEPGDSGAMVLLPGADGEPVGAGMVWARSTERDGTAWAIDLPAVVTETDRLDELSDPVDNATCVR